MRVNKLVTSYEAEKYEPKIKEDLLALIVDDSRTGRRIVTTLLSFLGFTVLEASNIVEALGQTSKHDFALFTIDRNLGDEDGVDLVRQLRTHSNCGEMPKILALTGNVGKVHSDAFFDAGADAFLTKPFTALQLGEILSALGFEQIEGKARLCLNKEGQDEKGRDAA